MSDEFYNLVGSEVKPAYHFYWNEGVRKILLERPGCTRKIVWLLQTRIAPIDDPTFREIKKEIREGKAIRIDHSETTWRKRLRGY